MRAAVFKGIGNKLAIEERPKPAAAPDQLVLKVSYCGICGSDLHATQEGAFLLPEGSILGHEFSGEVVESGSAAWKIGDRVIGNPIQVCDDCKPLGACRRGLGMLCSRSRVVGLAVEAPGAYAEFVKISASQAMRVPDGVDLQTAALAEPLAVAAHAIRKTGSIFGSRVLIIGAGPIGLAITRLAVMAGAGDVVVSELNQVRRERAAKVGANSTIDPSDGSVRKLYQQRVGALPEIVFECVGVRGLIQQCIDCVDSRGAVTVVGVCMHDDVIKPFSAISKEVRLQFVLGYEQEDFELALAAMRNHHVEASTMISVVVGFDELLETFESLRQPNAHGKVLLRPT